MNLCKEMGISYIQASCDNEIDPLYNPESYRQDWLAEVKEQERRLGVKVVNFYTGYQTYRTVGLASDDERVANKIIQEWFSPMLATAATLKAGLGFYMVALTDEILQSPDNYRKK